MKTVYNKKQLFWAFDLHSNNNHRAIIDGEDNRIYRRKLPNQPDVILAELEPHKGHIAGIVVKSTFNWYWLVDLLMDEGYRMLERNGDRRPAEKRTVDPYRGKVNFCWVGKFIL